MKKSFLHITLVISLLILIIAPITIIAQETTTAENALGDSLASRKEQASEAKFSPKSFIFGHTSDSYEFHISKIGDKPITVPLLVIVKSPERGWFVFSSKRVTELEEGEDYKGFFIQPEGKEHERKIVEYDKAGNIVKPFDLSITMNVFSIFVSVVIMLILFLPAARAYKKNPMGVPNKHQGLVEWLSFMIIDDVIKPSVGKDYEKFAPYLLTAFFFIFINNLMGLIPIFPFGANVTGNIAVTMVLALFTFLVTNIFGTKEYWKEVFWPDVPVPLKAPVPLMPLIEFISLFTKPFALMVRLFANILAGHMIILVLMALIFIFGSMYGAGVGAGVSVISILFTIFMCFMELLVAFIQAYVFTMLSSVFIGLARVQPHEKEQKAIEQK